MHQDQLKTTTTAALSRDFTEDRIWLNGREEDVGQPRLQACLQEIRRLAREQRSPGSEDQPPLRLSGKVHVASVNNFPTAAGLASSAAGYACLGGCPQGDWAGRHSGTPHPGSLQGDPTRGSSHTPGC